MGDSASTSLSELGMPAKVGRLFTKRAQMALQTYTDRVQKAQKQYAGALSSTLLNPWDFWQAWYRYTIDVTQRSILFWDTLRQRGNDYVEHERAGKPPVLSFEYEMVMDARTFERPVNYALVRIVPPEGIVVEAKRRPYIIIDPRAGHGPGIGGFKDDSEIGVALRAAHPVYFVMFFPQPQPGQTLLDVCAAEQQFVRKVRELHPNSSKPVIVGNCQGGWAAMMLAASDPELAGPIVINGAPMSYWSGAWDEQQESNPMRYIGGLLGGSWLASFMADIGNGIFDGAHLVENFEHLNPANTLWGKYYHLFSNVDTEPPRFLEFERWWGGFYLFNREEIDWIVQKMFVGNKVWDQENAAGTKLFDLRDIKNPIILFASMGDNITPPQQAFNWVADVYGSTEEIKARGQTIVGLVHEHVGHLGIFVSAKVATKEHASIVSVMKSVEALPPGLYAMKIKTAPKEPGKPSNYEIEFEERRLEDIIDRLNRFGRRDEKPFQAAALSSEINQRLYEAFVQPFVQAMSTDFAAKLMRLFNPLRMQRWALSDLNPWMAWLGPATETVNKNREAVDKDEPLRRMEDAVSQMITASLDYYRDIRDAISEASFYAMYGNIFSLSLGERAAAERKPVAGPEFDFAEDAVKHITEGGFAEAVGRAGFLLRRSGVPLPLTRLEAMKELMDEYKDLMPPWSPDERRRVIGRQEIICRKEPQKAIDTLPLLLATRADRDRFFTLMDKLLADKRVNESITPEQTKMAKQIRKICSDAAAALEAHAAHSV